MAGSVRTIGITGGIGSGKSEVRRFLSRISYPCADADGFASEVLSSAEGAAEIGRLFGSAVMTPSGQVNKIALRKLAFSDATARVRLEAFMHPAIQARFEAWRKRFVDAVLPSSLWLFYEASLLVEKDRKRDFDRLILVTADLESRRERIQPRGLDQDAFDAVVSAQATDQLKSKVADFTLINNGSLQELYASVMRMLVWLGNEFSQS